MSWEEHRLGELPDYFLENLPYPCFGCDYSYLSGGGDPEEAMGEMGCEASIDLGIIFAPIPDELPVITGEIVPQTGQLSLFSRQLRLFELKEFPSSCPGWSCLHDMICLEIGELSDPVSEGGEEEGVRRFLRDLNRSWCQYYEPSRYSSVVRKIPSSVGDKVWVYRGVYKGWAKAVVSRRMDDEFFVYLLGGDAKPYGSGSWYHFACLTVID